MKTKIIPEKNEGMEIRPFTDKYLKIKKASGDFADIDPVDMNGAYVAVDKYGKDNLEETQENINWRFQTEPVDPFDSEEVS